LARVVNVAFLKDEETEVLRMEDTRMKLRRLSSAEEEPADGCWAGAAP